MSIDFPRPVLAFVAYSGTGKTTLLEKLFPLLKQTGVRTSYIKHTHHSVELDQPGKDSYRLRQAGAQQVMLASAKRWALLQENPPTQQEPDLSVLLRQLDPAQCDLVLVEGFKHAGIPKIECQRAQSMQQRGGEAFYPHDMDVIAVACDREIPLQRPLPLLDINQPEAILAFILAWMGKTTHEETP